MMPIEVIQAAGLEYVGIDPRDIEGLKLIIGMPMPMPQGGLVVRLSKDFQVSNLKSKILDEFELKQVDGLTVYQSRQDPPVVIHQPDPRTIVVGMGGYFQPMMAAVNGGNGRLPALARRLSQKDGITVVAVFDQIRPMITGMLRQNLQQLPPPIQQLSEFAELTDAVYVNMKYGVGTGSINVAALGRDEASATQLEASLNNAIDFGRGMMMAEMQKGVEGEGPVNDAMRRYVQRVSGEIVEMFRPQRNGNVLRIDLDGSGGLGSMGSTGVLVGLLLPAVQAAREAARRMTASNNLKQIALAMHNFHSKYKKLPDRAIRDADGNPLLSWRVAILPFVEQSELYEQFHLDEPWDSPHNIKLLDQMPEIYVDPSTVLEPGYTVFQLPQGEGLMFEESGERKFRDVMDGTSNTIMVVESSMDAAVPWTKPADLEIDMAAPLARTGNFHQGGFHVVMASGAVIFLTTSIDLELFRALLTRAGKEIIP